MNDPDQTITWSRGDELLGRPWADDTTEDEERALSAGGRLVTLGFLTATLRRKAWVWCLTAVAGLAIGTGLYVKSRRPTTPPRRFCSSTPTPMGTPRRKCQASRAWRKVG